jgi:hypothetical protein
LTIRIEGQEPDPPPKAIEPRPSPSPATVSAERAISRKPQAPNELPTRSASMPEHLSSGCNAPRAGPRFPFWRRKRRDVTHPNGGGHHRPGETRPDHIPRTRTLWSPTRRSMRSRPSALLRVFRPCNRGVERRYIPAQWRGGHVARATGNSATEVTDESRAMPLSGGEQRTLDDIERTLRDGFPDEPRETCSSISKSATCSSLTAANCETNLPLGEPPSSDRVLWVARCPRRPRANGERHAPRNAVRGPEKGDGVRRPGSSMNRVSNRAGPVRRGCLQIAVRSRNPGAGRLVW